MSSRKLTGHIAIIITLVMLFGSVYTARVDATEPSDMALTYDFGTQTLSVNVSHYSPSPKNHYIENIEVLKNGVSLLNRSYPNQSVSWGVFDTFSVSAVADDNLTVTAFCSKGFDLTRWVIVTSTVATNTSPTETSTTTTSQPTDGPGSPEAPLGAGPAIAVSVLVVVFFIVFFAWLNPDRVPESLKQLGSRVRSRIISLGQRLGSLFQQMKTRLPSK